MDEKQLSAAYALNLCTVSVSQIVDYDDVNVMEQEYEAILNNLNLENIPHDEALLKILKEILDTITFFRIQEGDKKMMDLRYRQRMKNAVWNAVPNIGLLVAGGSPLTMLVSLASQVGIGYMNYRKEKANNELDHIEEQWKLQRTAIEQFNGLRRELFDTAWRLADTYNFSDELRLTERQIKHYDDILMDSNTLRRYDRLYSVKDNFVAYPPFWYYLGNTANDICRDETLDLSEAVKADYRKRAEAHFAQYWESNKYPLLREDQIASACALEYADILIENGAEKEKVIKLIDKAVKYAGNAWDILQLCAMGYLKADEKDKAADLMYALVNEKYNVSLNGQLLSAIYIGDYVKSKSEQSKIKYEILTKRVNNVNNLLPWPAEGENFEVEFENSQRNMLLQRYSKMIEEFREKYTIKFNRILPGPEPYKTYPDSFFADSQREERVDKVRQALAIPKKKAEYINCIQDKGIAYLYIDVYNEMLSKIRNIRVLTDFNRIVEIADETIKGNKDGKDLLNLQKSIEGGKFDTADYKRLQEFTCDSSRNGVFDEVLSQIKNAILGMTDMLDFSNANSDISDFCIEEDIPWPDLKNYKRITSSDSYDNVFIDYDLLGAGAKSSKRRFSDMKEIVTGSISEAITNSNKVKVIVPGTKEFDSYFRHQNSDFTKYYKADTLVVLDDSSYYNSDLVITTTCVIAILKDNILGICPYDKISLDESSTEASLRLDNMNYSSKYIDIRTLYNVISELRRVVDKD